MTVVSSAAPPASPMQATLPQARVSLATRASVRPPTLSTAPPQRARSSGFGGVHPVNGLFGFLGAIVNTASMAGVSGAPNMPAYSASKAALTQLARVAALEWADDGIRVNVIHPDAVFDTGLWSEDLVAQRAESYGMTADEYKRRNLLGTEVTSAVVAEVVTSLCGPAFAATTGAQIPIDGGSDRVV